MKLTVKAVAKMTGLTESTVRQYAWQKKLGKVEGRQKVFTLAEAKKLAAVKDGSKKGKKAIKSSTAKRKTRALRGKSTPSAVREEPQTVALKPPVKEKHSFWTLLGIGKEPKAKISLMETRSKK